MIDQAVKQAALRKVSQADCLYAAGFFDGEGSVGVYRRKSRGKIVPWQFSATANVTSSQRIMCEWFQERWGGHLHHRANLVNPALAVSRGQTLFTNGTFMWIVSHRIGMVFLADIEPYVILKKALVRNAIAFAATMGGHGGYMKGLPPEVYAEQLRLFERHRTLAAKLKHMRGRVEIVKAASW